MLSLCLRLARAVDVHVGQALHVHAYINLVSCQGLRVIYVCRNEMILSINTLHNVLVMLSMTLLLFRVLIHLKQDHKAHSMYA